MGTQILSAVAARLAAVLAGVNLYVTGRRELTKWAREVLVDAFTALLTGSFQGVDACKRATRLKRQRAGET